MKQNKTMSTYVLPNIVFPVDSHVPASEEDIIDGVESSNGMCSLRAEDDPTLNPCVFDEATHSWKVNPDSRQCRTQNQYVGTGTTCPTTCPDACVPLWESCPSGTGVLTRVVHTKSAQHIYQLTNETTLFDDTPNKDYKSYTECYAYGNQYCELPETRMQVINGTPGCYKDCPVGTSLDTVADSTGLTCTTTEGSNPVYCNPQYFSTIYASGIAVGCKKKALTYKTVNTCPTGYETFINDQFAVEWCMPKCPQGFVHDVTYTKCIATCNGTSSEWTGGYNTFRDVLDFYITQKELRCTAGTVCAAANQPGKCPVNTYTAFKSKFASTHINNNAGNTSTEKRQFGISSLATKHRTQALDSAYQVSLAAATITLGNGNSVGPSPFSSIECPTGMKAALPSTREKQGFCYDECPDLFVAAEVCRTSGQIALTSSDPLNCADADIQPICIASCPNGWAAQRAHGANTCSYVYPNNVVPTNPDLFVDCPDNGAFITVGPQGGTSSYVAPTPPVCIRKQFQRNASCPLNYILLNGECIENCKNNSFPIVKNDQITCVNQCPMDGRYEHTIDLGSNNTLTDAQCIRKNQTNGNGLDPLDPFDTTDVTNRILLVIGIGLLAFLFLRRFIL